MKTGLTAILLFISFLVNITFASVQAPKAKKSIDSIELVCDYDKLLSEKKIRFGFKVHLNNGKIRSTPGLLRGTFNWLNVAVYSKNCIIWNDYMIFKDDEVMMNTGLVELKVRIFYKRKQYDTTFSFKLLEMVSSKLMIDSIQPYQEYEPIYSARYKMLFTGDSDRYFVYNGKLENGVDMDASELLTFDGNKFTYNPKSISNITSIPFKIYVLGDSFIQNIPVASQHQFSIDRSGLDGQNGPAGAQGVSGGPGEHGGDGLPGWHAGHGLDGPVIEVIVSKTEDGQIELKVFHEEEIENFYISSNSSITLIATGGNGGNGGHGGAGGYGGSSTSDYAAGDQGNGGDGGDGGDGGAGGDVTIISNLPLDYLQLLLKVNVDGGSAGLAGLGGSGYHGGNKGSKGKVGEVGVVQYILIGDQRMKELLENYEK